MNRSTAPVVARALRDMPPDWFDTVFTPDGAWRDIYVTQTAIDDWDRFLGHIGARGFPAVFRTPDDFSLDSSAADILDFVRSAAPVLLAIEILPKRYANCHFFDASEIELDIDPKDIDTPGAFEALLGFMVDVGQTLSRDVLFAFENEAEAPVLSYSTLTDTVKYHRPWASV